MASTLIETPNGERLIILPESEYRQLVADAQGRKQLADVVVPAEVANRIFAGDHPVRVYREWRGIKAKAFAAATGMSPGHLSDIETGRRNPSDDVRARMAAYLGIMADDLIPANMD
jgi:DNA-binding transcriptional regulator YiaG